MPSDYQLERTTPSSFLELANDWATDVTSTVAVRADHIEASTRTSVKLRERRSGSWPAPDPNPILFHPARYGGQRLAQAGAEHTKPGLGIEQRAVRVAHHVPAVAREELVLAVFERRALMRAAVLEGADDVGPTQDENCVGSNAVWIETTRRAWEQFVEST